MSLASPAEVQERLNSIDTDLATRQNELETAAFLWFRQKREREKQRAEAFLKASGTVAERNAIAEKQTAEVGSDSEAAYEAQRAVVRVLDTRAAIGMSILRAQSRGGA